MTNLQAIAQRIVAGLQVQAGELIQVRDHADRADFRFEIMLAIDLAGATPLLDYEPPAYLERWLSKATAESVEQSGQQRIQWIGKVDRVIVLSGYNPNFALVSPAALDAWRGLQDTISTIEEERQLPMMVVATPTEQRAAELGLSLTVLETHLLPALLLDVAESQRLIQRALATVKGNKITLRTGANHLLQLAHGDRHWHGDDGVIDENDRQHKTIVSNLPAGSIYTTVLEEQTQGTLFIPQLREAKDVVFTFDAGRIVAITAANGADEIAAWLDSHSGEPRRVSHIGIGLNPHLQRSIGWTLVDEHIAGAIFLALGENRYMGGRNESSLNHDLAWRDASFSVDGREVVKNQTS